MTHSSNAQSRLIPVPNDELTKLRDLYLRDWPKNCVGYYTLDNFIRWLQKDPQIKALSILTLSNNVESSVVVVGDRSDGNGDGNGDNDDNDWRVDGTFVLVDRYQLFLSTLNPSNERLRIALSLLDWSRGYKVSSFLERHRPAVVSVVESYKLHKEYDSLTLVYHMPRSEAIQMKIDCPEGFVVREMDEDDAVVADNVWPNQHVGSLFLLKRLIKWNPNMGVFTKADNQLVAWCFRLQGGFLGALQVKDTHQRMGLGSLVLRAITKKIGQMNQDVTACVGTQNTPSRKMFERCGFKVVDKAYWLRTYPTIKDFEWVDECKCVIFSLKFVVLLNKMRKNNLVEIPFEDWPKLRDLYVKRNLESNSFYLFQNIINWLNKDPSLEKSVKLYSLNGDWSDGTFILQDHKLYITMNTLEESQKRLLAALHCLDKKQPLIISGFPIRIKKAIETYLLDLGMKKEDFQFWPTIWHHIELKKALEFNIDPPKGVTLSAVRLEDIETINDHWPHRHFGSELFISRLVKLNHSIGAYNECGELIAWCLLQPTGALGLLQVRDDYKRKGLGSLLVRAMAKINAEKGIETMAAVVEENNASRAMFKSLGFVEIDRINIWFNKPEII
ncbi:uncharacterized protein LOC129950806 [Eupeodes corollae]|uniref:uncharacterized protein LOC129950806 n=1 Tax=Eupeodes corollae TaxID=290404 RepID=UPI0024939151|nr:uncharacterized protein LOC129950806 [Eupeodes corollae]